MALDVISTTSCFFTNLQTKKVGDCDAGDDAVSHTILEPGQKYPVFTEPTKVPGVASYVS